MTDGSSVGTQVPVTDPDDPLLHDYTGLTDVALRRVREPAEGLFIAEGRKVISRALAAGYRMRSALAAPRWAAELAAELDRAEVTAPIYVGSEELLTRITGYHVHRGALAAMTRKPLPTPAQVLTGATRLLAIEGVVDHTNVGAIFRSAAGLGVDGVLLSPTCADPLYRRAVRVSMGAVLTLPYARLEGWPGGLDEARQAGFSVLALTPDAAALPLPEVPAEHRARSVLVLGTEGDGLAAPTMSVADLRVRIPMTAGIDSLNVAAAAAVACYELAHGRGADN